MIDTNFTPGSTDSTGVDTNVAIGGDGFFVVQDNNGVNSYTRAGNFSKSTDGDLITADGQQVLGFPAVNGAISQMQGLSPLQVGSGTVSSPNATTKVEMTANLDSRTSTERSLQHSGYGLRYARTGSRSDVPVHQDGSERMGLPDHDSGRRCWRSDSTSRENRRHRRSIAPEILRRRQRMWPG